MPPLDAGEGPALDLRLRATNPVRTELRWALELPRAAAVTIDVLDVGGRRVARLERGWLEAGRHERRWRPVADDGAALAPGAYLLRVRAGTAGATRKFVLVR
jgi:hypothetical protein